MLWSLKGPKTGVFLPEKKKFMKVFYSLDDFLKSRFSSKRFVLTMGVFDGVHRAHQAIIKKAVKIARNRKISTIVITFNPHPADVLNAAKKVPLLISLKHRLHLLEEMDVDCVMVLRFNKKLSGMEASAFAKNLFSKIKVENIVIGESFFFGKEKKGSFGDLNRLSKVFKYRINVIKALKSDGKIISSTRIRKLISKGDIKKASRLLSRPVTVLGTVTKGHKRGRIIGFPTANIDPHHEVIPPSGVYAVKVKFKHKTYNGILNIGIRPTFRGKRLADKEPTIEVHIFNFKESIYGKDLEIEFVKKIRKERRFESVSELRSQIGKDERIARRLLS